MSARLDYLAGGGQEGYTGIPDAAVSPVGVQGGDWSSGLLQAVTTLGTGYLSKRIDIDLSRRLYGGMPMPGYEPNGTYPGAFYGPGGAAMQRRPAATSSLGGLLPYLIGAAVVFVVLRKVAK